MPADFLIQRASVPWYYLLEKNGGKSQPHIERYLWFLSLQCRCESDNSAAFRACNKRVNFLSSRFCSLAPPRRITKGRDKWIKKIKIRGKDEKMGLPRYSSGGNATAKSGWIFSTMDRHVLLIFTRSSVSLSFSRTSDRLEENFYIRQWNHDVNPSLTATLRGNSFCNFTY